jgi:hypothetical protein
MLEDTEVAMLYSFPLPSAFSLARRGSADPASILCSFSLLAQRKRTKRNGALSLGPSDCPALLETDGRCGTRFAQTVLALNPSVSVMLGCVTTGQGQQPEKGFSRRPHSGGHSEATRSAGARVTMCDSGRVRTCCLFLISDFDFSDLFRILIFGFRAFFYHEEYRFELEVE